MHVLAAMHRIPQGLIWTRPTVEHSAIHEESEREWDSIVSLTW